MTGIQKKERITLRGGVLGPLNLAQLRQAKQGLDKVLKNQKNGLTDEQKRSLDRLNQYLEFVLEDHVNPGRLMG